MLETTAHKAFQRSSGAARLQLRRSMNSDRLAGLHQSGSAKVFLHRLPAPQAVFLNTSGGLTGGDSLRYQIGLEGPVSLAASTQTAERAYASISGEASVEVSLSLDAGARLDWLPQETLLYDNSSLRRSTRVFMAKDASLLLWEMVVLGRPAMGERPQYLSFSDRRLVTCADVPVWAESLRVTPDTLVQRQGAAILGPANCFATLAFIDPEAEAMAASVRQCLDPGLCEWGLSAWQSRLILRLTGADSWKMRKQFARIYTCLRQKALPRVWQMNGDIE